MSAESGLGLAGQSLTRRDDETGQRAEPGEYGTDKDALDQSADQATDKVCGTPGAELSGDEDPHDHED
ncbi:hypothetical protein GCM10022231_00740 [Gordonia caeni]|uniref:Uncharacterized protein n=1 Tax=Gordonia caeni TaxID=1007097 RepID=A0ABP7NHW3_9ACTN